MGQYLILIYDHGVEFPPLAPGEVRTMSSAYQEFGAKHQAAILGGNALESTSTATSVRPDGAGSYTVTDGPFTETKEALGGYFLVEAPDLDAAIAIGKDVPSPGGVEIRPVVVFG
jgi:hypothetical protein